MLSKIILTLIFSGIGAILYRWGGTAKGTKWRDWGIPCVVTALMLILGIKVIWWAFLLQFGLLWGALSTYFNLDDKKWGFWAHGLAVSLSTLPIAYFTRHWLGFALRTIILTSLITIWSEKIEEVNLEEGGRGFFIIVTLPLLLIG